CRSTNETVRPRQGAVALAPATNGRVRWPREVAVMHQPHVRRRSPYFRHLVILCLAGAVVFAAMTLAVAGSESVTHLDTTISEACHRDGLNSPNTVRFFKVVTWF